MILVTLGTQDKSFIRLLKEIDNQINLGNIKEQVIAQIGYTPFEAKSKMKTYDYLPDHKLKEYMQKANLIITHGGIGSVLNALSYNKKIIAFSRLAKYKEHINDHQVQIVNEFAKEGYILTGKISELDKILKAAKTFEPRKYKPNNEKFNNMIIKYIDNF